MRCFSCVQMTVSFSRTYFHKQSFADVLLQIGDLKNFAIFTDIHRKAPVLDSLFDKVAGLKKRRFEY